MFLERVDRDELGKIPHTANNYKIAIHEAGHSLLTLHFKDNWSFYKAKFEESGAVTEMEEVEEKMMTLEKRKQEIMIGFGGYLAEEIFFGYHDYGSASDFERVHDLCRRLVERSAVYGIKYHITESEHAVESWHRETKALAAKIERKTYSLMFKYERKVRKFLLKNKDNLHKFATFMCENNKVSYRDIEKLGLSNI